MCGIAGYIGKKRIADDRLNDCLDSLFHRGPDAKGIYRLEEENFNIYLLHTRLSIIDIDPRSNQPFETKKSVLVFNGEIYNYLEIRKELEALGKVFLTNGDTEVLNEAMETWGENALNKLDGMFTFIWFNKISKESIIARDIFGEKPLFYLECFHGIYFASEINSLMKLLEENLQINYDHIYRFIINGYKSLNKVQNSFFKNVFPFEKGNYFKFNEEKKILQKKYWNPKTKVNNKLTYQDAVELTKYNLIDSLDKRLRSDVKLAFCMSGGIDSNSLIALSKKVFDYDVHGFTIISKDSRYDEENEIDASVKNLDIKHSKIYIQKSDFIDDCKKIISSHSAPISTISYYIHWQLMKNINLNGYKVSISGTGADELFTGYFDHFNFYLSSIKFNKQYFKKSLDDWNNYEKNYIRNPYLKNSEIIIKNESFRDHIYLNKNEFRSYLKDDWNEEFTETNYSNDVLRNRMLNELFHESIPVILFEDDMNAMYYSIENRSPFLTKSLQELTSSFPTELLIKDGYKKSILRDAMKDIVPEKILRNRNKVGFNFPIEDSLNFSNSNIEYILDLNAKYNLINDDKLNNLLGMSSYSNSYSKFLFNIINSIIFLDNFST